MVAFAGFLGVLSPFVSLCLPLSPFVSLSFMRVAFAGFLGVLSPFVSLHVGGLCRVPGRLCLPLSPLVFLHVGGLCRVTEGLAFLCFPWSPFVSPHVGGLCLCRVPGRPVSICLPLSLFMWVAFAGFLGVLSPFVSSSPFMRVAFSRFLPSRPLNPMFSIYLSLLCLFPPFTLTSFGA